jgi:hypothetical protein
MQALRIGPWTKPHIDEPLKLDDSTKRISGSDFRILAAFVIFTAPGA